MYKSLIKNAKQRTSRGEKHRQIEYPDDDQEFAVVQKMMGNGRLEALAEDGSMVVARIRGSMRRYKQRTLVCNGDLVIISRWEFEQGKADVVHKFTFDEATSLLHRGDLPTTIAKAFTTDNVADFGGNAAGAEELSKFVVFGKTSDVFSGLNDDVDPDTI